MIDEERDFKLKEIIERERRNGGEVNYILNAEDEAALGITRRIITIDTSVPQPN